MTQAHSSNGAAVAAQLIQQLQTNQLPPYARLLADGPALDTSPLLTRLQNAMTASPPQPVNDLLLAEVRPPAAALRAGFDYRQPGKETDRTFRGMVSGNGSYPFDLPDGIAGFMEKLFETIKTAQAGIEFSERDLFHGHIVAHESNRDILVLFHAKEYPDQMLNHYQRKRYTDAGLWTDNRAFGDAKSMDERNFLWTLRTNKVFLLTDPARTGAKADPNFAELIRRDNEPLDSDGKVLGTVYENYFGTELLGVNYFPKHVKDPLFFAPRGGWGVVMYFEHNYPTVARRTIEQIYAATGDSLVRTEEELQQLTKKPTTT